MSSSKSLNVLFIAPLPPPHTGQSIASQVLLDGIKDDYHVEVVNFSKGNFSHGANSLQRIGEVLALFREVWEKRRGASITYLTLSQSIAGNLKDLVFLWLTRRSFQVVHLHGGGIHRTVFSKAMMRWLNRLAYRQVERLVILSPSLKVCFAPVLRGGEQDQRLRVIANSVDSVLLNSDPQMEHYTLNKVLRIVFLSNLIDGKGYRELAEAAGILIEKGLGSRFTLTFAGKFSDEPSQEQFLSLIAPWENVDYVGFVDGAEKSGVLQEADVFALPSSYPYEGQPISILEAYACGCAVITSRQGGIPDIFSDGVHGLLVDPRSPQSIANAIMEFIENPSILVGMSHNNREYARENFTVERYLGEFKTLFREAIG